MRFSSEQILDITHRYLNKVHAAVMRLPLDDPWYEPFNSACTEIKRVLLTTTNDANLIEQTSGVKPDQNDYAKPVVAFVLSGLRQMLMLKFYKSPELAVMFGDDYNDSQTIIRVTMVDVIGYQDELQAYFEKNLLLMEGADGERPLDLWLSDAIPPASIIGCQKIIKDAHKSLGQLSHYKASVDKETRMGLIKPYWTATDRIESRAIIIKQFLENQLAEVPKSRAMHVVLYDAIENITRMAVRNTPTNAR